MDGCENGPCSLGRECEHWIEEKPLVVVMMQVG